MAQQAERSRHRRPLVQCCPLSSNYFAYSSGVKGSGVEQHRICRSLQTDDAEQLADHGTAVGWRRSSIAVAAAANANADRFSPDTSVHQQSHRSSIDNSNNSNNSNNNSSTTLGEVNPGSGGARSRTSSGGARSRDRDGFDGYDGYENPFVGAGPDFGLAGDGAGAVDGSNDPSLVASAPAAPAPWRSSMSGGTPLNSGGISGSAGCGGGSSSGVAGVGTSGLASSSGVGALFGMTQGSARGDGVVIDGIGEGIGGSIEDSAGPSLGGRRGSSACSDSGGGGFARSAWAKFCWRYPLEGKSTWWMAPKQEEQCVTCMRWFPHREGPEGMRMLAVGYSSGKVGLLRFSDDRRHGESVCVVAAASKGRACNAVAWDPARPERIAAGWAKSRHDKCVGVYDINYVEEWLKRNGVTLAEAAEGRASLAAAAAAASAPASAAAASASESYGTAASTMPASPASAGTSSNTIATTTSTSTSSIGSLHGVAVSSGTSAMALADSNEGLFHSGGGSASSGIGNFIGALGFSSTIRKGAAAGGEVVDAGGGIALSSGRAPDCAAPVPSSSAGATSKGIGGNGGGVWPVAKGIAGWDAPKVAARKVHEFQPSASDGCYCLAWVPEHDAMLMAGTKHLNMTDTRARYYSMKTFDPHRGAGVSGIAFRPTDPWIFATWSDTPGEVVKIWDYRDLRKAWDLGKCRPTYPELNYLPGAATSSVIDIAWSPDDVNVLAVVRSDSPRRVCFWDVRGNTPEKVPQHYRYTKNPISCLSWQRRGLNPRSSTGVSAVNRATAGKGGGAGGGLVQKRSPENVARTLAEDQRVALKFPHRLLTTSAESITVENIGPMERCPVAVSCHGDVMRAQGFCELLGSMERSGVRTRADYDACDVISRPRGFHHHVRAVRKVIAYSPKPPDILEVMKWRAQAGYRTDPVFNRTDIFERELGDQIAATKGGGVVGQQQKQQQQSQMVAIFGSGIPTRTLAEIADVRSACRLWSWIARIEGLAAMGVTTSADRRRPGAGAGIGIGGPMGQPSTPRFKPRGERGQPSAVGWTEWNRLGLVDSGVLDILAEEFEDAAASQTTATPSHTRHPTLGCAVFYSPARALAIRACGWAPPVMMPSISAPISSVDGECDTRLESGDKRLKECPGVPEGLGDLMLACERCRQYERSAALAVFHGDLRAAVKALRRAGEAAKRQRLDKNQQQQQQQHQETAAKATSSKAPGSANGAVGCPQAPPPVCIDYGPSQGQRDAEDAVGNRAAHAQALWSDPAALKKLLHAISVCIAGYRPPRDTRPENPSQPQAHDQAHEATRGVHVDIFGDEGQSRMWRELTAEVLGRKELCGTDEPQAYLRACCAFLDAILEAPRSRHHPLPGSSTSSSSSNGSGNRMEKGFALKEFLQETALSLSDRTAVACMFLPTEELKAFLTAEAKRCVSGGILDGMLLVGMAPRGIQLLQAHVDRTADVQTAALASIRAAALYPNTDSVKSTDNSSATHSSSSRIVSWEAERLQVEEWLESYCILLDKWQFIFNRKKIRKFFEHERDRVRDSRPLSPQAASRLDTIKLRHGTPRRFRQKLHSTPSMFVSQAAFAAAAAAAAAATAAAVAAAPHSISADAGNVPSNGSSTGERPVLNRASSFSAAAGVSWSALAEASPSAAGQGATAGESGGGGGLGSHFGGSGDVVNNTRRSSGGGGFGGDYPRGGLPERRCAMCLPAPLERRYYSDNDEEDHDFDFEEEPPKPIIACCAKCKKPLPRCYICMQQSDAFDPSTEKQTRDFEALVREAAMVAGRRFSTRTERGGGREEHAADRRRTMLEIAFNWCTACRHGGHSIHLEQWFDENDECGVEGCRCRCRALDEPAARWPPRKR